MSRKSIIILSSIIILLVLGSVYLVLRRDRGVEEEVEFDERIYQNEELGYAMSFPEEWNIEAIDEGDFQFFHPALEEEKLAQEDFLGMYRQIFGIVLVGASPLTYIDGTINYNIEKHVYSRKEEVTPRQWYDVVALSEAFSSGRISEGNFIRMKNEVLREGREISSEEYVFDPWIPRGEKIRIGNRDVLKVTMPTDRRYDGHQYYIVSEGDYLFVFRFGYGGPILPREIWERATRHVRGMIYSLEVL